jgi:ArsR family transcriptional regulator
MSNSRTMPRARVASAFRALAHPKRLLLFQRLARLCADGACCCTDEQVSACIDPLARRLRLAKSTVSHHLKELSAAGLIRVRRKGKFNEFELDGRVVAALASFLGTCCPAEAAPAEEAGGSAE